MPPDSLAHVPRGTWALLDQLAARVLAAPHNLIAPSTRGQIHERHVLDSAQLTLHAGPGLWLDVGSGGGFPGLVLAAMNWGEVHLVESIGKKAAFLRETADSLGLPCTVHHGRVEALMLAGVERITARAVAPISKLLGWTAHLVGPQTLYILLKGRHWRQEVADARKSWRFDLEARPSLTDPEAAVLLLAHARPV